MAVDDHRGGDAAATALWAIGIASVVAGGLVAAVTGPLQFSGGSWLSAYLVLVCGVSQAAMGWLRAQFQHPSATRGWHHWACWNLGNALVIIGTLVGTPLVVDAGSVLLVVGLVLALLASRGPMSPTATVSVPAMLLRWGCRILLVVLAISIPIGSVLSHLRHG